MGASAVAESDGVASVDASLECDFVRRREMGLMMDFERNFVVFVPLPALLAALRSESEVDVRGIAGSSSTGADDPEIDLDRFNIVRTPSASATEAEKLFLGLISSSPASEIGLTTISRVTVLEIYDSERDASTLLTLDHILSWFCFAVVRELVLVLLDRDLRGDFEFDCDREWVLEWELAWISVRDFGTSGPGQAPKRSLE